MEKLLKFKIILKWLIPIVWCFAFIGMILCCFYLNICWNSQKFKTFHDWDFFIAYLLEVIGIAIFFVVFLIVAKQKSTIFQKIISYFSFTVLCIGILAVIITVTANCFFIDRVIRDYRLDCQLESDNQEKFNEAVNALIPQDFYLSSSLDEPDEFIQKAARNGYDKAQNAMGKFYLERARIALSDAEETRNATEQHRLIMQSESDFDRSIYWFLKAAQNQYGASQTNLGRIFMGDLVSNRNPDITIAKQWLLKAVQNGDNDAYYYLGIIYSEENLRDAYVYWSKGAELGNEDCARELEKPEFAMGIPADRPIDVDTVSLSEFTSDTLCETRP